MHWSSPDALTTWCLLLPWLTFETCPSLPRELFLRTPWPVGFSWLFFAPSYLFATRPHNTVQPSCPGLHVEATAWCTAGARCVLLRAQRRAAWYVWAPTVCCARKNAVCFLYSPTSKSQFRKKEKERSQIDARITHKTTNLLSNNWD
jgi:hypothetical protein